MSVPQHLQQRVVQLLPRHKEYVMDNSIFIKCPICGGTLDVTKERRECFNCYLCGSPLVFKDFTNFRNLLPKGESVEIDGRFVI